MATTLSARESSPASLNSAEAKSHGSYIGDEEVKEELPARGKGSARSASDASPAAATTVYEEEALKAITKVEVPETRTDKDGDDSSFTSYKVVTTDESGASTTVWRRFRQFEQLHEALEGEGLVLAGLELPEKKWFGNMDADFVAERRGHLAAYLAALVGHKTAGASLTLRGFLKEADRFDWPAAFGAIDLSVHDLPHKSSCTEWWYYNTHLTSTAGREFSAFVCFFRVLKFVDREHGNKKYYAHALNWAITDVESGAYYHDSLLDKDAPKMIKKMLEREGEVEDPVLRRAMTEVLDKGNVPLPDRLFNAAEGYPKCSEREMSMDFEDATLTKDTSGRYRVKAAMPDGSAGLDLLFDPTKPAIRHGLNGVVKGHEGDDMFYYFLPRCRVTGTLHVRGNEPASVSGAGWYDHEFGGRMDVIEGTVDAEDVSVSMDNYAWEWAACQLDNGYEITGAVLVDPRDPKNHKIMETRVVVVDPRGRRLQPKDLKLEGLNTWTSVRTFSAYPTRWRLTVESMGIDLTLKATVEDQEFMSLIAKPAFWEGRVDVDGTFAGAPITGRGFVERNGFTPLKKLTTFFKAVGERVRTAVRQVYPDHPSYDETKRLVASDEFEHYMAGVPCDRLAEVLLKPVREIADRGGKSWRSYGVLACVDIVGGDSRGVVDWLAMPEFMHVGSLIVDDIQDRSETRRGGPCAHLLFGEPLCINAGTAAYFQGQKLLDLPGMSDKMQVRMYDLYFQALRAGHAGQALDISGLDYLMPTVVESGDIRVAEERILGIHMLKTAVPAGVLARMGAVFGKATPEVEAAVGGYFEAVGLAFQIMDDVLNLRGLYTNDADLKKAGLMKTLGEDITAGKVTIPVVKAMGRIKSREERAALWDTVSSKPEDRETVVRVIKQLEELGAVEACVEQATKLVEDAWKVMDAAVPDSFAKIMLRSFGWFVIERAG